MRKTQDQILDTGRAGPDGRRGVVVRYPRSAEYFRRALARVSVYQDAVDDPAARLLAMTRRILSPEREVDAPTTAYAPGSRA